MSRGFSFRAPWNTQVHCCNAGNKKPTPTWLPHPCQPRTTATSFPGSCLPPHSHPRTSSLAFQQLQSRLVLPIEYDKLYLPKGLLRASLWPESGWLTQHHSRQATNLRHFTGNRLDNLQSCITCDSQILSIIIPTQIPFEIIWISSSKTYSIFQTVQLWELQVSRMKLSVRWLFPFTQELGATVQQIAAANPWCQPAWAPQRTSHRIRALGGLEAARAREQSAQLGHQHVF